MIALIIIINITAANVSSVAV